MELQREPGRLEILGGNFDGWRERGGVEQVSRENDLAILPGLGSRRRMLTGDGRGRTRIQQRREHGVGGIRCEGAAKDEQGSVCKPAQASPHLNDLAPGAFRDSRLDFSVAPAHIARWSPPDTVYLAVGAAQQDPS